MTSPPPHRPRPAAIAPPVAPPTADHPIRVAPPEASSTASKAGPPRPRALFLLALSTLAACVAPGPPPPSHGAARIASQTVLSDELLWDLGERARARVIAVSPLADDPRYSAVAGRWPADRSRLPGTSEALLARAPDLVVLASFTDPEARAFIEAHGVATLILDRFTDFDDLHRHTLALADAAGDRPAGDALWADYDARLRALTTAHARGRAAAAISWSDGLVAGAATSFDAIAAAAGLRNLAAEQGLVGHVNLSLERLVALDPEVLVIACEPLECRDAEREIAARPGLAATRAAREGGVFALPARDLSSTGAGMLRAAERLQARRLAHTEAP